MEAVSGTSASSCSAADKGKGQQTNYDVTSPLPTFVAGGTWRDASAAPHFPYQPLRRLSSSRSPSPTPQSSNSDPCIDELIQALSGRASLNHSTVVSQRTSVPSSQPSPFAMGALCAALDDPSVDLKNSSPAARRARGSAVREVRAKEYHNRKSLSEHQDSDEEEGEADDEADDPQVDAGDYTADTRNETRHEAQEASLSRLSGQDLENFVFGGSDSDSDDDCAPSRIKADCKSTIIDVGMHKGGPEIDVGNLGDNNFAPTFQVIQNLQDEVLLRQQLIEQIVTQIPWPTPPPPLGQTVCHPERDPRPRPDRAPQPLASLQEPIVISTPPPSISQVLANEEDKVQMSFGAFDESTGSLSPIPILSDEALLTPSFTGTTLNDPTAHSGKPYLVPLPFLSPFDTQELLNEEQVRLDDVFQPMEDPAWTQLLEQDGEIRRLQGVQHFRLGQQDVHSGGEVQQDAQTQNLGQLGVQQQFASMEQGAPEPVGAVPDLAGTPAQIAPLENPTMVEEPLSEHPHSGFPPTDPLSSYPSTAPPALGNDDVGMEVVDSNVWVESAEIPQPQRPSVFHLPNPVAQLSLPQTQPPSLLSRISGIPSTKKSIFTSPPNAPAPAPVQVTQISTVPTQEPLTSIVNVGSGTGGLVGQKPQNVFAPTSPPARLDSWSVNQPAPSLQQSTPPLSRPCTAPTFEKLGGTTITSVSFSVTTFMGTAHGKQHPEGFWSGVAHKETIEGVSRDGSPGTRVKAASGGFFELSRRLSVGRLRTRAGAVSWTHENVTSWSTKPYTRKRARDEQDSVEGRDADVFRDSLIAGSSCCKRFKTRKYHIPGDGILHVSSFQLPVKGTIPRAPGTEKQHRIRRGRGKLDSTSQREEAMAKAQARRASSASSRTFCSATLKGSWMLPAKLRALISHARVAAVAGQVVKGVLWI